MMLRTSASVARMGAALRSHGARFMSVTPSSSSSPSTLPAKGGSDRYGRLALFENNSVLFPGTKATLPLCEPRHQFMISDLVKSDRPTFGVVTLKAPSPLPAPPVDPAAPASSRIKLITDWAGEDIGTEALLRLPASGGTLNGKVDCEGLRRFRILHQERNLLGFHVAEVEFIDSEDTAAASAGATEAASGAATSERMHALANEAKDLFHKCIDLPYDAPFDVPIVNQLLLNDLSSAIQKNDMASFSYKLAALLPAARDFRQELLSCDSTESRLRKEITVLKSLIEQHSSAAPTPSA